MSPLLAGKISRVLQLTHYYVRYIVILLMRWPLNPVLNAA